MAWAGAKQSAPTALAVEALADMETGDQWQCWRRVPEMCHLKLMCKTPRLRKIGQRAVQMVLERAQRNAHALGCFGVAERSAPS